MNFNISSRSKTILEKLDSFVIEHIYPAEQEYQTQLEQDRWQVPPVMEALKAKADAEAQMRAAKEAMAKAKAAVKAHTRTKRERKSESVKAEQAP